MTEAPEWVCDDELARYLEQKRSSFRKRQMTYLEDSSRDYSAVDMGTQLPHEIGLADEIMAPLRDKDVDTLVDIGSGIGTFAFLGSHYEMDSVGVECSDVPYEMAVDAEDDLKDRGLLHGSVDMVHEGVYDWGAHEGGEKLDEADVIVAYIPGEPMRDLADWLIDAGSDDALYVFPELAGEDVNGYTPSSLNKELDERLQTPIYEKSAGTGV